MTRAVSYDISDAQIRAKALDVCVAALGRGEVIYVEVDSQPCLVADAFSHQGVSALLAARRRGRGAGLAVLVRDPAVVDALFENVDLDARALMAQYWPGPLTLIGRPTQSLRWDLGAAGELVGLAVRMPQDSFVRDIVAAVGPCAYINAFPDARVSSRGGARAELGDAIACYATSGSEEQQHPVADSETSTPAMSSVVDVRTTPASLLRVGALSLDVLRRTCPGLVAADEIRSEPPAQ